MNRHMDWMDLRVDGWKDRHINWTYRQAEQTNRQTDRWTCTRMDEQIDIPTGRTTGGPSELCVGSGFRGHLVRIY